MPGRRSTLTGVKIGATTQSRNRKMSAIAASTLQPPSATSRLVSESTRRRRSARTFHPQRARGAIVPALCHPHARDSLDRKVILRLRRPCDVPRCRCRRQMRSRGSLRAPGLFADGVVEVAGARRRGLETTVLLPEGSEFARFHGAAHGPQLGGSPDRRKRRRAEGAHHDAG